LRKTLVALAVALLATLGTFIPAVAPVANAAANVKVAIIVGATHDATAKYRSYADQVAIREYYGARAAAPGTSRHGLGTALDVQEWPDVYGFDTPRYAWLVANGPAYGWSAPASVRADAAYPEYWHFEYAP
jgi:LAS superfamily LD-carboxypeptidase LdcB